MELLRLLRHDRRAPFVIARGADGRAIEEFVRELIGENNLGGFVTSTNSAAASAYGSSDLAQQELGDLDPATRAAASLARQLQDPLIEIVRLHPVRRKTRVSPGCSKNGVSLRVSRAPATDPAATLADVRARMNPQCARMLHRILALCPQLGWVRDERVV